MPLSPLLAQISFKINDKTLSQEGWQFGGCFGSCHAITISDVSYEAPKGIEEIVEILDGDKSNDAKKAAIRKITSDRKGFRGATFFNFGLSWRTEDTRAFYEELDDMIDADDDESLNDFLSQSL